MKVGITHADIQKLYSYLSITEDDTLAENRKITNRDFGVKDYTVSSNTAIECMEDESCELLKR